MNINKFICAPKIIQTLKRYYPLPIVCVFLGVLTSSVSKSFFPIIFFTGFSLIIFLLNMISKGTEMITFDPDKITIFKKNKSITLSKQIKYQKVEHRMWKGVKISSCGNVIFIWENEFRSKDWHLILKNLKKFNFSKELLEIYTSWLPDEKY